MRTAPLLAVMVAALACKTDRSADEANAVGGPVRVLEAGNEPRTLVRYRPAVGKTRNLTITTKTRGAGVREQVEIRTPSIGAEGDARYELTLRTVDDLAAPGSAEERRLRNAQGTFAAATISREGELRSSEKEGPGEDQGLIGVESWLHYAIVPFPRVAVGPGATWEVDTDRGVARYELVAVDRIRAVVKFRSEARTSDLAAASPTAEGQVTLDLTGPPAERFDVTFRASRGDATPATTVLAESR